jgi:DNA-directed RNA polymerase specialized sigma subunit
MAAVTAILKLSGKESEGLLRIIIRRAIQQEIRRSLRGGGEMSEMKVDVAAKLPRSICEAAVKDALSKLPFAEGQMLSSMYYGKETVSSIAKNTKRTRAEVVKVYRSEIDHLKEVLRG